MILVATEFLRTTGPSKEFPVRRAAEEKDCSCARVDRMGSRALRAASVEEFRLAALDRSHEKGYIQIPRVKRSHLLEEGQHLLTFSEFSREVGQSDGET